MDEIKTAYKEGKLLLFVGAGVSGSLGLPNWAKLISKLAVDLGYDPDVFKTYGDFLQLAEFYKEKNGHLKNLVDWMKAEWNPEKSGIEKSEIHTLIAKSKFEKIYTTNYDHLIEAACDGQNVKYKKIATIDDIAEEISGTKQIVKLHGDLNYPERIVLTESSYFDRIDFQAPLDMKLRADILGKSVLFIGYSLSDINIRLLFYKLAKIWEEYKTEGKQPMSYIFSNRPNPIQEEVFKKRSIKMLTSDTENPSQALVDFFKELES